MPSRVFNPGEVVNRVEPSMPMVRIGIRILLLLSAATSFFSAPTVFAFEIGGSKWFRAQADFYVDMEGLSATQISWNDSFIEAMEAWSEQTRFNFALVEESADPCLSDGKSSVDFDENFCGTEFGKNTLAVTVRRFQAQLLGPPNIVEADVIINAEEDFDIFDGNLVQFGKSFAGLDFGRVALHELGHVIGLDHEQSNPAIMAPNISNLFELQEDDIAGVEALYSGLASCEIDPLVFGEISDVLNGNDCTVSDLTVGGNDHSFLDLFQFQIYDTTHFDFKVTSTILDAVLVLATTDLEYLDVDTSSPDDCNSELSATLAPGSYFLMVNTYSSRVKEDCGIVGNYRLRSNFSSTAKPFLGGPTSLLGTQNFAHFSGGITASDGASFTNLFSPDDSLDIEAEIRIDVRHRGKPGFLVVAALLDDQLLMLNSEGEFVDVGFDPDPVIPFARKVLGVTERISIATDLVPEQIGIDEIDADIVVGYALDSNPADIFYHASPLNLTVQPQSGED